MNNCTVKRTCKSKQYRQWSIGMRLGHRSSTEASYYCTTRHAHRSLSARLCLTLKWSRYVYMYSHQWSSRVPMDPNSEKYFPEWIWRWNAGHWYSNPKEPKYSQKKSKIGYTITNWRPKKQFPSRDIRFPTEKGKTTFLKEFFLEIWLIIEIHCWNEILKKLFGCAFMGKTHFEQRPENANLCLLAELAQGRWNFFATKRSAR